MNTASFMVNFEMSDLHYDCQQHFSGDLLVIYPRKLTCVSFIVLLVSYLVSVLNL